MSKYPWPDKCPHCGSEYAEKIGVVKVSGKLSVEGHSVAGLKYVGTGDVEIEMVANPDEYFRKTISLYLLSKYVEWDDFGKCSECQNIVERGA